MEVFGAHPVPGNLRFFASRAPAALLQVDLFPEDPENESSPEALAERFRAAASNRWDANLDYDPGCLPLTEALLLALFDDDGPPGRTPPVSEPLVRGLGCYIGELARRNAGLPGFWRDDTGGSEAYALELGGFSFDPIGHARAFLKRGEAASILSYVRRALASGA